MMDKLDITIKRKEQYNSKQFPCNTYLQANSSNNQDIKEQDKMEKAEAIILCKGNGLCLSGEVNYAAKNKTINCYWVNPNINRLSQNWWLLLNDYNKNILFVFNIPENSISKDQIKFKNDFEIDLQIKYDDKSFEDNRSGIKFRKWLVKQFFY